MFCEVFFTDAVVADEARIGDVNNGWTVANTTLLHERSGMGAGADRGQRVRRWLGRARWPTTSASGPATSLSREPEARAADEPQGSASPASRVHRPRSRPSARTAIPWSARPSRSPTSSARCSGSTRQRHKAVRAAGGDIPGLPNFSKLLTAHILRHNRDLGMQLLGARGMLHGYDDAQRATLVGVPGGTVPPTSSRRRHCRRRRCRSSAAPTRSSATSSASVSSAFRRSRATSPGCPATSSLETADVRPTSLSEIFQPLRVKSRFRALSERSEPLPSHERVAARAAGGATMRSKSKRLALVGAALLMTATTFVVVQNQAGAADPPPPDKVVLNLGLGNNSSPSYWRWTPGVPGQSISNHVHAIDHGRRRLCRSELRFASRPSSSSRRSVSGPSGRDPTADNGRMGVCYFNPNFGIDPGETLIFKVGTAAPSARPLLHNRRRFAAAAEQPVPDLRYVEAEGNLFLDGDPVGDPNASDQRQRQLYPCSRRSRRSRPGASGTSTSSPRNAAARPPQPPLRTGASPPRSRCLVATSKQSLQTTTFYLNDLLCPGETITRPSARAVTQVSQRSEKSDVEAPSASRTIHFAVVGSPTTPASRMRPATGSPALRHASDVRR